MSGYWFLHIVPKGLGKGINHDHFPNAVLRKDEVYHHKTMYKFQNLGNNKDEMKKLYKEFCEFTDRLKVINLILKTNCSKNLL